MNNNIRVRCYAILLLLSMMGCTEQLPHQLIDESSMIRETPLAPGPQLIIIAQANEIKPPPDLDFAADTYDYLQSIDFESSFALLWERGRLQDSHTVKDVQRKKDVVVIKVNPFDIGPGNIILKEYTYPYQLIEVKKTGEWNREIRFVVEDEDGIILVEETHFIP